MLEIQDTNSVWKLKIIKYNENFDSIIVEYNHKPEKFELILGSDRIILEARDAEQKLLKRYSFRISELNQEENTEIVPLDISKEDFCTLALAAHEEEISFNEFIVRELEKFVKAKKDELPNPTPMG